MLDEIKPKGFIQITRYDKHGKIDGYWEFENLVTTKGMIYISKMLGGDISGINKIGLGTVTTAADIGDLQLYNRIVLIDTTRDYSIDKQVRFLGIVPANTFTTTQTYSEIGLIYKSLTEDVLITRAIFTTPVQQKNDSSLSISYALSVTSS